MTRTVSAILLILTLAVFAARAARHAQLQSGNYEPAELGKLPQTAPPELSTDSTYSVPAYPLYPPDLAPGEGKQETEAYCAMCHSPRYITMQPPLPAATWEAEVSKMNKTFGANIPEAVSPKILRYLGSHYTTDTRRQ
jgi:hypothetical protein